MNKYSRFLLASALALTGMSSAQAATFTGARNDFRDETIYFTMTTRFYDGDTSNNTYCWDGVNNVNDPEWRGDFKGLIQKLDYIKALGFTAVWITPVVENASGLDYHGYHAFNFDKVDPRYESDDCKFQDLIDAAHARGMKVILDIVLQHTGNFGENFLCPMFVKDYSKNLSNILTSMKLHPQTKLPANYDLSDPKAHDPRIAALKNEGGGNGDNRNHYHHVANEWNWDDPSRWWGQIAGDCVDLNTENPEVTNYLVRCYGKFIAMGVDGFRIDTAGHISRLTFNKAFIPQFEKLAEQHKAKRNGGPFFMFGEVCARDRNVTYRNHVGCSPYWYTWKEEKDYAWDYSEDSWSKIVVPTGQRGDHVNAKSVTQQGNDYLSDRTSSTPTSKNAKLEGNKYHTPDHSKYSGLSVIDFPMHWNFRSTKEAWGVRGGDEWYNDATYNVTYVDSHDYAPDGAPENQRFAQSQSTWASNLDLMFTFRGIPCIYYGSEIEFKKGCEIDKGALIALKNSGRAYFGGYIEGSVKVNDFADYSGATGNMAVTLNHPLSLHIQRLNKLRAAIPALRKGQYSTDGCSGSIAFKRRYTDSSTDSYVLVTIGGNATFSGIENGTYTDAITGDVKTVTDGKLSASCTGAANMRIYVLSTDKTPAPGKVGEDGKYLYATSPVDHAQGSYPSETEPLDTETKRDNETPSNEPVTPLAPTLYADEYAAFFENDGNWAGSVKAWVWSEDENFTGGTWPGEACLYLGNNIWKWHYTGSGELPAGTKIIFSSGGSQTKDMAYVNGGYYTSGSTSPSRTIESNGKPYPEDGEKVDYGQGGGNDDPTNPTAKNYTIYFDNSESGWNQVYCYAWDVATSTPITAAWPGDLLTEQTEKDGKTVYTVTFKGVKAASPAVMFSNENGLFTSDFVLYNGAVYSQAGTGIEDLIIRPALNVYTQSGVLFIQSPVPTVVTIARADGTSVRRMIDAGVNMITDMPRGFYIVDRTKVIL